MYLAELKLWNFRKYGINGDQFETSEPGLVVRFEKGVNVLVGENDSGKTAIIDAIRYVLKTQSQEFIQLEDKDFHKDGTERTSELKIECTFSGFSASDAGHFLEWIGFDDEKKYQLKIWLTAKRKDNSIYPKISAGADVDGTYMEGEARDLLRVIYLKPLRDALSEMTHGRKSRLAQILKSLDVFKDRKDEHGKKKKHLLETHRESYGNEVNDYFTTDPSGSVVKDTINEFLTKDFLFHGEDRKAAIKIDDNELNEILRELDLVLEENKSGLGSLNLLCMAAELLHLKEKKTGLKLTLIEELEAHLHPQYQLRVIDFIEKNKKEYGQFILTTHSTTLASKINLENLIICQKDRGAFPMGHKYTQLEQGDYQFLQRFLDATKANLFFARGVIIVEGDAENLLIPTIAEIIGRPLHAYGVSVVNVGSTAFKRYAKIFLRKDKDDVAHEKTWLGIPVSIISDLDIRSFEYYEDIPDGERPKYWICNKKLYG
ncbi:AAA family ATPase [Mangrovibacterium marinum]|uniref:ATP-dependent nuclease n=1 Tax=Mangrovibacterium marinum TaxID=1639118 RepID=UPI002A188E9B|nr:AAA family ATPase [Mangrovibacterium marinum]